MSSPYKKRGKRPLSGKKENGPRKRAPKILFPEATASVQKKKQEESSKNEVKTTSIEALQQQINFFLRSEKARKWCSYEWFYSFLEVFFFTRDEFQQYLIELGLEKVSKLTRMQWNYIRVQMGKPRRFSPSFIHEEQSELEAHRRLMRENLFLMQGQHVLAQVFKDNYTHIYDGIVVSQDSEKPFHYIVDVEGVGNISVPDNAIMIRETPAEREKRKILFFTPAHNVVNNPNTLSSISSQHLSATSEIDLPSVASLFHLLQKKEFILGEIESFHKIALDHFSDGVYPEKFRRVYAWLILQLNSTNEHLEPHLQKLSELTKKFPPTISQNWFQEINERCNSFAQQYFNQNIQDSSFNQMDQNESMNMRNLIISCISIVLHLLQCSEKGLSETEAAFAIKTAIRFTLRPYVNPENRFFLNDIDQMLCSLLSERDLFSSNLDHPSTR